MKRFDTRTYPVDTRPGVGFAETSKSAVAQLSPTTDRIRFKASGSVFSGVTCLG